MAETMSRGVEFSTGEYLVAANTLIEAGDMVATSSGYAVPVSTATGLKCKGIATKTVDNRTGNTAGNSGLAGGAKVPVESSYGDRGLRAFKVLSDTASNAITQADVGTAVYGKDAKTVTKSNSGTSLVCEVFKIDTDGLPLVIFNQ